MTRAMTAEEFVALRPRGRGYAVYMAGARSDQPNIPNEKNPYPKDSLQAKAWDEGQFEGVLEAQDDP